MVKVMSYTASLMATMVAVIIVALVMIQTQTANYVVGDNMGWTVPILIL